MRALTWQGINKVAVTEVPDPVIEQPHDAIVRVTSTAICGSDLHLLEALAPYLQPGDVLGHEFMGIVEEVGSGVENLQPGDRVVVPFVIACGHCWMCQRGLNTQCETTQTRSHGTGANLFGYTSLYGSVPGGQAERVRVPHADFGPVKLPETGADERYLYLSDILPTAWQGVKYAEVPEGGSLAVMGLGPVGQLAVRSARQMGIEHVIGVDLLPDRLAKAEAGGATVVNLKETKDLTAALHDLTDGRGPDGVVDAVGMEAHGSPIAGGLISATVRMPKPVARKAMETVGVDQLAAMHASLDAVRRGGTVSLSGVYGGGADPMPMMQMFDRQLTLRMGQCNVQSWTDELLDIVSQEEDVLGLEDLATHRVGLDQAAEMYQTFRNKDDNCLKVVMTP